MYEKIKDEMKKILEIVKEVPQEFKDKCFELLLSNFLERQKDIPKPEIKKPEEEIEKPKVPTTVHGEVKAFFRKYKLKIDLLESLFYFEQGMVRPIFELKTDIKAHAQIQLSLLSALKEAINSGSFRFNIEEVRESCKEKGYHDSANFTAHFKNKKDLFKSLERDKPIELSEDGLKELAETIIELTE